MCRHGVGKCQSLRLSVWMDVWMDVWMAVQAWSKQVSVSPSVRTDGCKDIFTDGCAGME